jgi:hypothetical protein
MSTARSIFADPYLLRYLVTSPVPMEWPMSVTWSSPSVLMSVSRSAAKVSQS